MSISEQRVPGVLCPQQVISKVLFNYNGGPELVTLADISHFPIFYFLTLWDLGRNLTNAFSCCSHDLTRGHFLRPG